MGEALSTVAWPGPPCLWHRLSSQARGTHLTEAKQAGPDGLAKTGQGSAHRTGRGWGPLPASALTLQDTLGTTGTTS